MQRYPYFVCVSNETEFRGVTYISCYCDWLYFNHYVSTHQQTPSPQRYLFRPSVHTCLFQIHFHTIHISCCLLCLLTLSSTARRLFFDSLSHWQRQSIIESFYSFHNLCVSFWWNHCWLCFLTMLTHEWLLGRDSTKLPCFSLWRRPNLVEKQKAIFVRWRPERNTIQHSFVTHWEVTFTGIKPRAAIMHRGLI